jgi:hypothetical protein
MAVQQRLRLYCGGGVGKLSYQSVSPELLGVEAH